MLIMERYTKEGPFEDAANLLVQTAIDKGSADNVTAIVVFLQTQAIGHPLPTEVEKEALPINSAACYRVKETLIPHLLLLLFGKRDLRSRNLKYAHAATANRKRKNVPTSLKARIDRRGRDVDIVSSSEE